MKHSILVTGFDPFGGEAVNPSWEAVRLLPDSIDNYMLCKLQIPTIFAEGADAVLKKAAEISPVAIVCVGQAGGRSAITPERIAVNIRDARIPDNAGNQPKGEFVACDGPAAYFSTAPVEKMVQAIETAGLPATASNSAGAFVCNDVFYTLLHSCRQSPVKVGFVHVPYLPQQGSPSLPLAQIVQGLEAAISALILDISHENC